MQLKDYCNNTERTRSQLNNKQLDNIHMALGLVTEAGELADVFKKNLAYNKPIDWTNVQEEIGDLLWYISGLCNINGFDLEEILQNNIDKLRARYPEKFDEDKAINRNLHDERKILEQVKPNIPQELIRK
jgi:NTP pyrophosphatase (non-canonical NTP hydrolase)